MHRATEEEEEAHLKSECGWKHGTGSQRVQVVVAVATSPLTKCAFSWKFAGQNSYSVLATFTARTVMVERATPHQLKREEGGAGVCGFWSL
jgi:hypothetical protein